MLCERLKLTNPRSFFEISMHMLGIMLHGVWKGAIGQHGDADVNDNGRLLLQMC